MRNTDIIKALAVFAGTIIGVGIFGLPYVALKSGFFVVLIYFIIVAGLAISVHYLLGEIAHDTIRIARIPGYAGEYLGSKVKKFSFVISSLGLIGALLAYLILGGQFLYSFFSPFLGGSLLLYTLFFFAIGAVLIYRGIGTIGALQVIIQAIFIILLFLFFFRGIPFLEFDNFFTFDVQSLALPYGVILFSLWGVALVPEVKEMVNRDRKKMIYVLVGGIILAALCYLFFTFSILGVSGANTTKDAITGFSKAIGNRIVAVGYVFGLIITFTSFITLGLTLKKIFSYDMRLNRFISWALACFAPFALYAFGLRNFIDVIGLTGAFFLGMEGIIVILIYRSFVRVRFQRRAGSYTYVLIALLLIGMITEVVHFL
ncbi:amino acid permease [Patescibacteria group bacterium AH-259-L05]|nr:amino acid permease [Patescibacteria group bacterium AH-259-L05]